jgi:hypothetical protein
MTKETFNMSLEQALAEQTAAIRENTRAIAALHEAWNHLRERANHMTHVATSAGGVPLADPKPAATPVAKETAPVEPVASAPAVESPSKGKPAKPATEAVAGPTTVKADAPAKTADAPTPAAEPVVEQSPPSTAVTLQQLQERVLTLAKTKRDDVKALLARYGATSASSVKEGDRASVYTALESI